MSVAYLDASALVKLFASERETIALAAALLEWSVHVSSELIAVEAMCAARRLGGDAAERASAAITGLDLIPFTAGIREAASGGVFDPPLRTLDAIHLASALSLRDQVDVFIAYDDRLSDAAKSRGLTVLAPR